MIGILTDHLWQSTLFVLAAAVVAAALRRNGAHIRHAVWVVASLKFLVPFALLMRLGGSLPWSAPAITPAVATSTTTATDLSITVDRIAQPFTSDVFSSTVSAATQPAIDWMAMSLAAVWACGFAVVALMRLRGWRRIRAAVRASVPVSMTSPVPVRSSPGLLEPGVVGVWRPVLLVPAGIEQQLSAAQLQAVLEHEFCHIQRRDNLTSAIHMIVEAVFWFHPLVWWVGARLVDERERACDERVLRVCGEPQTYAESILNVCKLYVESPLACVSGVTGSDLKRRIAAIMVNRVGLPLNFARKVALTTAAVLAVAVPLVAGMLTAPLRQAPPASAAQEAKTDKATFDLVSIKPCAGASERAAPRPGSGVRGAGASAAQTSPGYVYWDCVTLTQLVDQAYGGQNHPLLNTVRQARRDSFQPKRIRGGPSWVDTDRFTIEGKVSVEVTNPALEGRASRNLSALPAAMSQAVRAMLEDRFQLKVRRATEQQDMYALTVAKGGLNKEKMRTPVPGDCVTIEEYMAADPASRRTLATKICGRIFSRIGGQDYSSFTLQGLATDLSRMMDLFVLDRTGIDGTFNFTLELPPGDTLQGDDRIIVALEKLGLKIERTKGPAEYLVIESVQKPRPDAQVDAAPVPSRARGAGGR